MHPLKTLSLLAASLTWSQGRIPITVTNIQETKKGTIALAIYSSADGFPDQEKKAIYTAVLPVNASSVTFYIDQLPDGKYACAAFHDENNNGKLDTNILGIPKEGVGISNKKGRLMSKPKFEQAACMLKSGQTTFISLQY